MARSYQGRNASGIGRLLCADSVAVTGKMRSGDQRYACSLTWVSERLRTRTPFLSGKLRGFKSHPHQGLALRSREQYVVYLGDILAGVHDIEVNHWYFSDCWQDHLKEDWKKRIVIPEHTVVSPWELNRINVYGALEVVKMNLRRAL